MKRMDPDYLRNCIPENIEQRLRSRLRNQENISVPLVRTNLLKSSFIYSTINHWNDLNPEIRNFKTISSFKKSVTPTVEVCKSYISCGNEKKIYYI